MIWVHCEWNKIFMTKQAGSSSTVINIYFNMKNNFIMPMFYFRKIAHGNAVLAGLKHLPVLINKYFGLFMAFSVQLFYIILYMKWNQPEPHHLPIYKIHDLIILSEIPCSHFCTILSNHTIISDFDSEWFKPLMQLSLFSTFHKTYNEHHKDSKYHRLRFNIVHEMNWNHKHNWSIFKMYGLNTLNEITIMLYFHGMKQ